MARTRRRLASLITRGEEAVKRGWYGVNALKRIAASEDKRAQLTTERKVYFPAHQKAQDKRRAVAAQIDAAADRYGPLLGWEAKMDATTTPDCRSANGKNFSAYHRPGIGWPGTTHANCRCRVVEPYPNARTID